MSATATLPAALPRHDHPERVLHGVMIFVCAALIVLSQFAAHWRLDVVDDQMFGYFGWRIAQGGTVYLDVWDNKPPGVYWLNALGFALTGSYAGVVVLCAAAVTLSHILFYVIAASIYFPGTAALLTMLASFYLTHTYLQGATNRTETYLVLCDLAAMALYVRGHRRERWWMWWLAGACCGGSFLFKQVGLTAWGAMGLHTIVRVLARELDWRSGLRRCVLLTLGLAATLALAAGALALQGALSAALFATFEFNRGYFASGNSSFTQTEANRRMLLNDTGYFLLLPLLMLIAAWIHGVTWRLRPHFRPPEVAGPIEAFSPAAPRTLLLFSIWYVASFYGAIVSPHHFRHYLIPTLPPMLLICGHLLNVIKTEIGLVRRLAQRGWVVGAFVAMGYFALSAGTYLKEGVARVWWERFDRNTPEVVLRRDPNTAEWTKTASTAGDPARGYNRAIGELIADEVIRLSRPEDRIQCWGYFPGVYLYAQRASASRFFTTEKLGHVGAHAEFIRRELHDTLVSQPPALFVISAEDYAWCVDPPPGRPPDWIGRFIGEWLDRTYVRVVDIPGANVLVFQRRDLAPAALAKLPPGG